MMIRKILSSILIGSMLVSGIAVCAPATENNKVQKEEQSESGFVARCKAIAPSIGAAALGAAFSMLYLASGRYLGLSSKASEQLAICEKSFSGKDYVMLYGPGCQLGAIAGFLLERCFLLAKIASRFREEAVDLEKENEALKEKNAEQLALIAKSQAALKVVRSKNQPQAA